MRAYVRAFSNSLPAVQSMESSPRIPPLSFMKAHPHPSSIPSKLIVNFFLPYQLEIAFKEVEENHVSAEELGKGIHQDHQVHMQALQLKARRRLSRVRYMSIIFIKQEEKLGSILPICIPDKNLEVMNELMEMKELGSDTNFIEEVGDKENETIEVV
ncbi:hypothetical protein Scep_016943 [Stephania cephalantha]|uniref:Uncharacterized protein n=1 Tax=Stephania cephalantha TaxID=152367 RepID=A0AAP0IP55_9MAGN